MAVPCITIDVELNHSVILGSKFECCIISVMLQMALTSSGRTDFSICGVLSECFVSSLPRPCWGIHINTVYKCVKERFFKSMKMLGHTVYKYIVGAYCV